MLFYDMIVRLNVPETIFKEFITCINKHSNLKALKSHGCKKMLKYRYSLQQFRILERLSTKSKLLNVRKHRQNNHIINLIINFEQTS